MGFETILVEQIGRVGVITLNRPDCPSLTFIFLSVIPTILFPVISG